MACPTIVTGDRFLIRVLDHIDCQAQLLGSYGYQALGQPGSMASTVVTGLLTLFIALFGLRLLFGPGPSGRDVVYDVLKIGIVLTLAFSWPAFRTVIHDVVLKGPAEIAATVAPSTSLPDTANGFTERLQRADIAMVRLTEAGAGRNAAAFIDSEAPGGTFAGSALDDDSAFGWARLVYLSGIIGSLALLRIVAGLLLALAPLAAGLLLFPATRGLFSGWLKGLVLAMTGSIGISIMLAVELAVIEPWLADALRVRGLGYATPSAPIELFALVLAFALAQLGVIWLLAKIAFTRGWSASLPAIQSEADRQVWWPSSATSSGYATTVETRAQRTADSIERLIKREEQIETGRLGYRAFDGNNRTGATGDTMAGYSGPAQRLGDSYRRTAYRRSPATGRRDARS